MLLVGRLLQGASTSLTWSSALPLIRKTLSGNQKESMSLMGIMTSIGAVLAPAIAGFIFSSFGWPAVAIAAAIVIIIDAISLWWGLRKAAQDKSSDEVHASETTPLLQPQEPDDNPYLSSINPWYEQHAAKPSATPDVTTTTHEHQNESTGAILGEVGRVAAGTLADPEARSSFRALVSNDRMKAALFGRFVAVLIVTGIDVVLPTYLFRTLLWESGPISLVLSLLGLPSFTAPIVDRLSQRFGATKLAPVGFVLTASIGLLRFILPGFTNAVPMLFGVIAATGIGLVMVNAPLTAEFNSVVEELGADLNSDETDVADQAQAILHVTIYSASLGSSAFCGWAAQTRGWDMLTLVWSVLSLASAIMVTTIFKARAAKRALKRTIIPRRRTSHSP